MPKGLKRYYGRGHLHFLTFSCYRRLPLLATVRARQLFVRELTRVRAEYGFLLIGYVVMPEHVHLLISEPCKEGASSSGFEGGSWVSFLTTLPFQLSSRTASEHSQFYNHFLFF
jgi:REP element-mobilizing transposase RayT